MFRLPSFLHWYTLLCDSKTAAGHTAPEYAQIYRFGEAKSGVYCGPLKLLAAEVFTRSNELGIKCDLVTGEERRYVLQNFLALLSPVSSRITDTKVLGTL